MFSLPPSAFSDLMAQIGQLIQDLEFPFILAVAIPAFFYILYRLVKAIGGDAYDDFDPHDFEV